MQLTNFRLLISYILKFSYCKYFSGWFHVFFLFFHSLSVCKKTVSQQLQWYHQHRIIRGRHTSTEQCKKKSILLLFSRSTGKLDDILFSRIFDQMLEFLPAFGGFLRSYIYCQSSRRECEKTKHLIQFFLLLLAFNTPSNAYLHK